MGKWPAVIVDDFVSERVGGRLAGQRRLANLSRNFGDLGVVDHSKFIGRGLWQWRESFERGAGLG